GEVWLNDTYVGKVAGPFALGDVDITAPARAGGSNLLALRILAGAAPWTAVQGFHSPPRENVVGYGVGYGLDGGAAALPLGVTGDVAVRAVGPVRLAPLRVAAQPGEGRAAPTADAKLPATVTLETVVTNDEKVAADVVLRGAVEPVEGGEEIPFARSLRVEPGESAPLRVVVEAPAMRLWWPASVGPQALYRATLEARVGEQATDCAQAEFGVRSAEIPEEGAQAALTVNGTPLTLRIAEWRPVDRFLQRSRERTEQLLRLALANGFNTIRVWDGGGLADPDFYQLCDRLGLLVIQDLPLLGDIARPPLDELLGAVDGVALETRSHPCLVAYVSAVDVPDSGPANARLAAVAERLGQLAPDAYAISAVGSQAGPATWEWVDNRTAAAHERRAALLKVYQVSLPDAPPADLGFLERDALPAEMSVAPWPLTGWWEAHGGRPATLEAAQAWLGPVRSEDALLDLLRLWQAENARRQAAAAAGGAVMVSCLNESWPRVGGALVDYGLQPRPAADVLRRFLAGPVVFARADRQEVSHGETVRLDLMGVFGAGKDWWQAKPVSWKELRCRVQGLDGHVWAEQTVPLADGLDGLQQVGTLTWDVGDNVPAGAYLAVTEAPGTGLASDVVPLGVRAGRAPGRVRVLWLAGEAPKLAGVGPIGRERLAELTPEQVDAVYLGPGDVPPPDAGEVASILALVRGGAGVLLDGPPSWIAGTGLTDLLPARPALGPLEEPVDPARPEILLRSHPAFLGLSGDLPAGLSDGYYELAEGADTLARFGPSRPLLVEGRRGQGRVLWWCTPRDYRRRLQVWAGMDRFALGLLAYAGRLPFGDVQALLDQPSEAPLAAMANLPAAALAVGVATSPVAASPGHPEAREVTVRNDGATPVLLGTFRLADLPRGATAGFSAGSFTLLPGQTARSILTIRYERRGQALGKARLLVSGWGAASVSIDLPLELGTPS
ncbi:MAG: hypothetical protein HYU66_06225, partial [Armatimonadetes bacterium]|nr:hypothetical protein [Armatimonadota bacterium]